MTAEERAIAIADKIVPAYRDGGRRYSCTGNVAKMWEAAFEGAFTVAAQASETAKPSTEDEVTQWRRTNRSTIQNMLSLARTSYLNADPTAAKRIVQRILVNIRTTRPNLSTTSPVASVAGL